jgi:hypothetical protein
MPRWLGIGERLTFYGIFSFFMSFMSRAIFVGVDVVVPYGYSSTPHWPNAHNM